MIDNIFKCITTELTGASPRGLNRYLPKQMSKIEGTKLVVDVHYADNRAYLAALEFNHWYDAKESHVHYIATHVVGDYEPGSFYKRELPVVLQLLESLEYQPECILLDCNVVLDEEGKPGLGMHLANNCSYDLKIIGIAKSRFKGLSEEHEILRGNSSKPLVITAYGLTLEKAKGLVCSMHGPNRIPYLVKRADSLAREYCHKNSQVNE